MVLPTVHCSSFHEHIFHNSIQGCVRRTVLSDIIIPRLLRCALTLANDLCQYIYVQCFSPRHSACYSKLFFAVNNDFIVNYNHIPGGPKKTGPLYIFPNIQKTTEDK